MIRIYSMQNKTDTVLIQSTLDGEENAYALLIDRYKTALYRHCFAVVHDEDVAKDIAQDAFITAYYKLARFDQSKKFSTWLFKIATNKALDTLRKRKHQTALYDEAAERIIDPQPTPEIQALYSELFLAVRKLPLKLQISISLFYWQGLGIATIAEIMDTNENTVKSWLRRAKEQLRKELR